MAKGSVLLLGASGLVGSQALELLARDSRFHNVVAPVRRPLAVSVTNMTPKIEVRLVDFERPDRFGSLQGIDTVICALGTTIKKAGSKAKFRKVDFEYCLTWAKLARKAGAERFVLVTSMGASPKSRIFYSRVKGEVEEALKGLRFPYLCIVRPSVLAGERAENRPGEKVALQIGFLLPKKYKPIHARIVAAAMLDRAADETLGVEIVESDRLQDFGAKHPELFSD